MYCFLTCGIFFMKQNKVAFLIFLTFVILQSADEIVY